MIDLGPNASYILIAYLGVAIVSFGIIVLNIVTYQKQKTRVKQLEEQINNLSEKSNEKSSKKQNRAK